MALTTEQRLANLETRVAQIDGANLADPTESELAKIKRDIKGIKTTQAALGNEVQRQLTDLRKLVIEMKTALDAHLSATT